MRSVRIVLAVVIAALARMKEQGMVPADEVAQAIRALFAMLKQHYGR